ncbi:hypothetical protein M3J09_003298 [Ascochyta lentis]
MTLIQNPRNVKLAEVLISELAYSNKQHACPDRWYSICYPAEDRQPRPHTACHICLGRPCVPATCILSTTDSTA